MREIEYLPSILDFLKAIGLTVDQGPVPDGAFLPGLRIRAGRLVVDADRCLCAGDVLHEAGHLAVIPAEGRARLSGDVDACLAALRAEAPERAADPAWTCAFTGGDTAAITWSYAAAAHLGMPTRAIFIQEGYKADRGADPMVLHDQIAMGFFPGILHLAKAGLTASPLMAEGDGVFPKMVKWVV